MRDRLAGATALAALLLGAGASLAQQPVVIGGSGQPSVYVNTQVLNSLTPGFAPGSPYAPYTHGAYGYQQPGAFGQAAYGQPAYGQPAYGQQPATIGGYYITAAEHPSVPAAAVPAQPGHGFAAAVGRLADRARDTERCRGADSTERRAGPRAPCPPACQACRRPPSPRRRARRARTSPTPAPRLPTIPAPTIPAPIIPAPGAPDVPAADVGASAGRVPAIPPPSLAAPEPLAPESLASKSPAPIPPAPTPPAPNLSAPEPAGDTARGAPPPPSQDSVAEDGGELLAPPEPAPPAKTETRIAALPPAETPTAALPPVSATAGPQGGKRLIFAEGTADLDEAAKQVLRAAAETLKTDQNARVQLLAYAGSDDDSASRARRLSLSRALAVRQFLIKEGVRSTRMDVRALGSKFEDGPADRVDILPANR